MLPRDPWQELLTVVVCSSPVPSNPDTSVLRAVFASLSIVAGLSQCPKIIQLDGPQPSLRVARVEAYAEFESRVRDLARTDAAFTRTRVYRSRTFLFASHNLAAAIMHVNTTFLFALQHDYVVVRPFDASGLLRTMVDVPVVKHVRLNMRPNMPARGFDGVVENASLPGLRVPLARTCGWSDAPHIARTEYYRTFVIPRNRQDHNGGRRKFMEESLHYPLQRNGMRGGCWETKQQVRRGVQSPAWPADFDEFGTYLYGAATPSDGSYTHHHSLRGSAPQWGLEHNPFADMARPAGRGSSSSSSRRRGSGSKPGSNANSRQLHTVSDGHARGLRMRRSRVRVRKGSGSDRERSGA